MAGIGAHEYGGRWNSPGRHVAYASGNLTLAMLEVLVHVEDAAELHGLGYVFHRVRFPEAAVATVEAPDLPAGWNAQPVSRASQVVGDEWIDGARSPVLAVPSVVVPGEVRFEPIYMTYLVNPHHPDTPTAVEVGEAHDLSWDARLAGS